MSFLQKFESCADYFAALVLLVVVILMAFGHKVEMRRGSKIKTGG